MNTWREGRGAQKQKLLNSNNPEPVSAKE
jgi:hypothetical protein